MKRYLAISLMLICTLLVEAQGISVSSFRLLETDLDANTAGTMERDQNGETAALIKVVTTQTGFTFDGGALGIVKTKQTPGEVWVYIPRGSKKITIKHPQLGILRDYFYPVAIESARTYEMVLIAGEVQTIVRQARTSQYVVFQLTPPNAVVELNGELLNTEGGVASKMMKFGTYNYRVQAPNYLPEAGNVTVNDPKNKHVINVALKSNFSAVTLKVDGDAEIWVNGERKGTGSWTGNLGAGTYEFETRKQNHRNVSITRDIIATTEPQTITLQAPTPILGEAEINSSPAMADIYIDGKKVGQTPQLVYDLSVGQHQVKISKSGYKDYTSTMIVKEGETFMLSAKLEKTVAEQPVVEKTVEEQPVVDKTVEEIKPTVPTNTLTSSVGNQVITVGNVSFTMVRVDGGTFQMGATSEQGSLALKSEKPVHQVTLSSYYIGKTEVTQALWETVMGSNPSTFKGRNFPVENVSWDDCQNFITKLNKITGRTFRLPTEAEWEFAARGGMVSKGYMYSGSDKIGKVAWYSENGKSSTHNVKNKIANELGIYDMSGNVWEWCSDWLGDYQDSPITNPTGAATGTLRVIRGGSVANDFGYCRISTRGGWAPGSKGDGLGFRIVLQDPEAKVLVKPNIDMPVSSKSTTTSEAKKVITVGNVSFNMIHVNGGTFTMGATSQQGSGALDSHQETLSSYYIGETEVTQALWGMLMDNNPSNSEGSNKPVESVKWEECQEFIRRLNQKTGLKFRLPTEAEWEYAARGGNRSQNYKYSGSNNLDDVGIYNSKGLGRINEVKTKQANELGIYDMSGNVYEWCQDSTGPASDSNRVIRGGSWFSSEKECEVLSRRARYGENFRRNDIGFRLACSSF